ncbi:MAG TPA: fibro-slime domain-containing protein [Polyangiaceae bacterium]|nr:fibro-slime domain-containing protein [Polyangiaceae bacterium]
MALVSLAGCSASGGNGPYRGPSRSSSAGSAGSGTSIGDQPASLGGSTSGPELTPVGDDPMKNEEDCDATLELTVRDFTPKHPDFEAYNGQNEVGCGIVASTLGPDSKPVFFSGIGAQKRITMNDSSGGLTFTSCVAWDWMPNSVVTSKDSFDQWYRDVDGVNQAITVPITLVDMGGENLTYDSKAFFPIDGMGFGNTPNQSHNFHFTTEGHVKFGYVKGQKFTFRGDDDLWIFVNGKLALDLGGLHMPISATIDFDAQAAALGISPGGTYQMDIFHAERHTSESNFRVETNIRCFTPVVVK